MCINIYYTYVVLNPELCSCVGRPSCLSCYFRKSETGTIFTGSGSGEAVTIKRSQIGEDNEVKFNKSTIGIATKKALETASARIIKRMIKRGIFEE